MRAASTSGANGGSPMETRRAGPLAPPRRVVHMNAMKRMHRCAAAALIPALLILALAAALAPPADAQTPAPAQSAAAAPAKPTPHHGGEASLKLPDLGQASFLGFNGRTLLSAGLVVCLLGLAFGLVIYSQLKNLPVHQSMLDISEEMSSIDW